MDYKVTKIIDGDTFEVTPMWHCKDKTGSVIRAAGYDTPERGQAGYGEAKEKLTRLLLNEEVELGEPLTITYDRLLCKVFYDGKDVAEYFREDM